MNHSETTRKLPQREPWPTLAANSGTILLVEDEGFVLEAAFEILNAAGFNVLKARTGEEARYIFEKHTKRLDLLLTDVVLPGQDGRDLAKYLTRVQPGLKTIFISGYPVNVVSKNGDEPNGVLYLAKPFSLHTLLDKVREALREKASDRARGAR